MQRDSNEMGINIRESHEAHIKKTVLVIGNSVVERIDRRELEYLYK